MGKEGAVGHPPPKQAIDRGPCFWTIQGNAVRCVSGKQRTNRLGGMRLHVLLPYQRFPSFQSSSFPQALAVNNVIDSMRSESDKEVRVNIDINSHCLICC
jgi:hypothetical protein